jgi:hypothetical protein
MPANRGHQRHVDKQKRKRVELKKKQSAVQAALRPSALFKRAEDFPIETAWLSSSWRDQDEQMPGLLTAIMTRRSPGGMLVGTALVDRTCLGIRDGYAQVMTLLELESYLREVRENIELELVDPLVCLSVVFHAIDYARSLGFSPHRDFPTAMFGPRPEPLMATPLAKPSKPLYVAGPNDDTVGIVAKLRASVGDEFRFAIPSAEGDSEPVEARDTMRLLESMRNLRRAELVLGEGKTDEAESIASELLQDSGVKFDAMELMARISEARGDLTAAMDWLHKALDSRGDQVDLEEADSLREELRRLMMESSRSDGDSALDLFDDTSPHGDEVDERRFRV